MATAAIEVDGLTKRYGRTTAVDDLSFTVPEGAVFGLLGPNGAGKTTTIRCLMNLIPPDAGGLRILGHDTVRDARQARRRVGYVGERPQYINWMSVQRMLWFHRGFYPDWDQALAEQLIERLYLDPDKQIGALSAGSVAKLGLVLAISQRPELLILDDPTSGLDPLVRREFLEAVISTYHAEGGTILYSSHAMADVERIADHVTLLYDGRKVLDDSLDAIHGHWAGLHAVFPDGTPESLTLADAVRLQTNAHHVDIVVDGDPEAATAELRALGATRVDPTPLDLEEIFVERVAALRRQGPT